MNAAGHERLRVKSHYLGLIESGELSPEDLRTLGYRLLDHSYLEEAERCLERSLAVQSEFEQAVRYSIAYIALARGASAAFGRSFAVCGRCGRAWPNCLSCSTYWLRSPAT
ncbi:MAG: hypothetical protein JNL04_17155 [Rhodospirillaceae bacterium]|nr:hypothetical protein [Rhodospirillaceae bacterium]